MATVLDLVVEGYLSLQAAGREKSARSQRLPSGRLRVPAVRSPSAHLAAALLPLVICLLNSGSSVSRGAAPDAARGGSLCACKIRVSLYKEKTENTTVLERVCRQQQAHQAVCTALPALTKMYHCLPSAARSMRFMPEIPVYLSWTCTYLFVLLAWTCTIVIFR